MTQALEDFPDHHASLQNALDDQKAKTWTSMPGIIVSFNAGTQTAVVQPSIQSMKENPTDPDKTIPFDIPPLQDVPVEFPSGGGHTLTFDVAVGDECMLDFSARNIDGWWSKGGVQPPMHPRQHSLSDAICRVGVRSKARSVNAKAGAVQLRSDDGSVYIEIANSRIVTIKAPAQIILDAPLLTFTGQLQGTGAAGGSGDVTINGTVHTRMTITSDQDVVAGGSGGKTLLDHRHPVAGSETGPPNE